MPVPQPSRPHHQILLMFRLNVDPNTIQFLADLADSGQQGPCHAASELSAPQDSRHPPSRSSRENETHKDTCHVLLSFFFFFLIIPSYSNFTNSVNLYNTSESETYKKSAGNIKKKNKKQTSFLATSITLPHKTETL